MKITARDILGDSRLEMGSSQTSGAFPSALQTAFSGQGMSLANLPAMDRQGVDFLVKVVRKAMVQAQGGPFSLPGHVPMGMAHRPPHPELVTDTTATSTGEAVPRPESLVARTRGGAAPYQDVIQKAASKYGLDPDLVTAVVRTESSFDPNATSPAGAMGLMQLMPGTARELGVSDPYNPEQNVMGGAKYLRQLLDRYHGKKELALAAYNWGPGNLERRPQEMPRETRQYVSKVMAQLQEPGNTLA